MKRMDEQTYYGILEVNSTATPIETLDADSPAVNHRSQFQDSSSRKTEGPMEEESSLSFTALSINAAEETTGYHGKKLRQIREGMGIDLKTVSTKTRVNTKVLEWIEEEVLEKLPPLVYLKSFLKSYARCLGLDPQKVTEEYLEFLRESKKK